MISMPIVSVKDLILALEAFIASKKLAKGRATLSRSHPT